MIDIVTIAGSVRPGNYTAKALALVNDELRRDREVRLTTIDPSTMSLAVPGVEDEGSDGDQLRETVSQATGVVLATPEYHGSFSSVTKLVIENLGFPSVLASKPVTLLGVAAGQIGAVKSLEQLRSVCSHVGAIVLPGPVSVARVRTVFDAEGECQDEAVEMRLRALATGLLDYIRGSICPRIALEQMVRQDS